MREEESNASSYYSRDHRRGGGGGGGPWDPLWEYVFGEEDDVHTDGSDSEITGITGQSPIVEEKRKQKQQQRSPSYWHPQQLVRQQQPNQQNQKQLLNKQRSQRDERSETTESFLHYILPSEDVKRSSSTRTSKYQIGGSGGGKFGGGKSGGGAAATATATATAKNKSNGNNNSGGFFAAVGNVAAPASPAGGNKGIFRQLPGGGKKQQQQKKNDQGSNSYFTAPASSFEMSFLSTESRNEESTGRGGGGAGFWRRPEGGGSGGNQQQQQKKKGEEDDQDSILSFLDQPYEIDEHEHQQQQQKRAERQLKNQKKRDSLRWQQRQQQQQQQKKKNKLWGRNKNQDKDEMSWVSALSSSFDNGYSPKKKGRQRKLNGKNKAASGKKGKKGIFPWRAGGGGKRQADDDDDKDEKSSFSGESWSELKRRAEAEAAKSRGDTERSDRNLKSKNSKISKNGVFSFDDLAGAIDNYIEGSSSEVDDDDDEEDDSVYSSDETSVSYESSYRSESDTASFVTEVEEGSTAASYSVESRSVRRRASKDGKETKQRVRAPAVATAAAAAAATATAAAVGGAGASSPPQTSEVRLKYQPNELSSEVGHSLTPINENEDHDQELSTINSEQPPQLDVYDNDDDNVVGGDEGDLCESFDESSKQAPSIGLKSPVSSLGDEASLSRFFLPSNRIGKVACCRLKELGIEAERFQRETGIPIHELSKDELETLFPKLRSISEDVNLRNNAKSVVIGNSQSFEKDLPAHLQAIVAQNGPQSLYEYEYEKGTHKVLVYERFGPDPRNLLRIVSSDEPPQLLDNGLVDISKVIIQVEASTVSRTDCCIREGRWMGNGYIPLPNSPGADMVGKIYRIDKQSEKKYGLTVGDRVITLTKYGGNARYLGIDADQLVKVSSDTIDPAEAACLAETYLTAFQCLHYNQSPGQRYRKGSQKGKSVLVLGPMSPTIGRAIAQLSTIAAFENVYATSKPRHYQRLTSIGILPLPNDPLEWFERLQGRIDVVISFDEEVTPLVQKVLTNTGEILIVTQTGFDPDKEQAQFDSKRPAKLVCKRKEAHSKSRLHAYNVHNEWDESLAKSKKDLEYLVELLEATWVMPHILDRIPLSKVARAHEIIEVKNVPGFIVCEPWLISKSRAVLL